jgi:hypothetical protein
MSLLCTRKYFLFGFRIVREVFDKVVGDMVSGVGRDGTTLTGSWIYKETE